MWFVAGAFMASPQPPSCVRYVPNAVRRSTLQSSSRCQESLVTAGGFTALKHLDVAHERAAVSHEGALDNVGRVFAPQPPHRAAIFLRAAMQCLFTSDASRPLKRPPCAPIECAFGGEALECPFPANGSFVRDRKQDAAEECADPFMEGVRRPLLPL